MVDNLFSKYKVQILVVLLLLNLGSLFFSLNILDREREEHRVEIERKEKTISLLNEYVKQLEAEKDYKVEKVGYSLNDKERDYIERVVQAESDYPFEDKMNVAQVIRNRSDLWKKSPSDIVKAPYQFTAPYKGKVSDEVKIAVYLTFDLGYSVLDKDVTHFYSTIIDDPSWVKHKEFVKQTGRHKYFR